MFTFCSGLAVISFLNLRSIYKLVLIPVVLLSVPSWLVAVWWYGLPAQAGSLFFLRTLGSVTIASVLLHSIGLRRMGSVFQWFKVPLELRQMWNIMVSQVAGFSELVTDMALARSARTIKQAGGGLVRRQAGRQMGILFSRTYQRGNQLAFAMDARQIADIPVIPAREAAGRWRLPDFVLVCFSIIIAIAVGVAA
jgi:energy-coupling factor transporter transmembrane protein EcfT